MSLQKTQSLSACSSSSRENDSIPPRRRKNTNHLVRNRNVSVSPIKNSSSKPTIKNFMLRLSSKWSRAVSQNDLSMSATKSTDDDDTSAFDKIYGLEHTLSRECAMIEVEAIASMASLSSATKKPAEQNATWDDFESDEIEDEENKLNMFADHLNDDLQQAEFDKMMPPMFYSLINEEIKEEEDEIIEIRNEEQKLNMFADFVDVDDSREHTIIPSKVKKTGTNEFDRLLPPLVYSLASDGIKEEEHKLNMFLDSLKDDLQQANSTDEMKEQTISGDDFDERETPEIRNEEQKPKMSADFVDVDDSRQHTIIPSKGKTTHSNEFDRLLPPLVYSLTNDKSNDEDHVNVDDALDLQRTVIPSKKKSIFANAFGKLFELNMSADHTKDDLQQAHSMDGMKDKTISGNDFDKGEIPEIRNEEHKSKMVTDFVNVDDVRQLITPSEDKTTYVNEFDRILPPSIYSLAKQ